jgi:type IV pilus assembly protein PilC
MEVTQRLGMGLVEALDLCIETSLTEKFKHVLGEVKEEVQNGSSLSEAMSHYPKCFDTLILGMVGAGEKAGILDRAFNQIKVMTRRNYLIKKKIRGLMIYPAIVTSFAIACVTLLMTYTVPMFIGIFQSAGMKLPLPTLIMVKISDAVTKQPIITGICVTALIATIWRLPAIFRAVPRLHKVALRIPVIKNVQKKVMQANFTRTLAQLMDAEVQLLSALYLCRIVSPNYEYRAAIARATIKVSRGTNLLQSFTGEEWILSKLVVKSLGFGESTGRMEEALTPLADMLDSELAEYIDSTKTIIEPLVTLFIGGIVGFVMLAMFIPIFNLPKAMS